MSVPKIAPNTFARFETSDLALILQGLGQIDDSSALDTLWRAAWAELVSRVDDDDHEADVYWCNHGPSDVPVPKKYEPQDDCGDQHHGD